MTLPKYKEGDKVRYKEGDPRTYTVYAVYSPTEVSLALPQYPDTEQDDLTDVNDIESIS